MATHSHANTLPATQLIRKHTNPDIRNILIIAMTASAIEGDKERCIASGMNNYLAKPVRAQTLKGLLESYLNKQGEGKDIPNLQAEAQNLVKQALNEAGSGPVGKENHGGVKKPLDALVDEETGERKMRSRPSSVRSATQRWLGPNGKDGISPS
jgi:CheY-like chemotaxis protein